MKRILVAVIRRSDNHARRTSRRMGAERPLRWYPTCTDEGTTVECTGKVAGLGGTTFEITVDAAGIATVECTNPGGNVAPGQDTEVRTSGTTGEQSTPRNGQFRFTGSTLDPEPLPPTPPVPTTSGLLTSWTWSSATRLSPSWKTVPCPTRSPCPWVRRPRRCARAEASRSPTGALSAVSEAHGARSSA